MAGSEGRMSPARSMPSAKKHMDNAGTQTHQRVAAAIEIDRDTDEPIPLGCKYDDGIPYMQTLMRYASGIPTETAHVLARALRQLRRCPSNQFSSVVVLHASSGKPWSLCTSTKKARRRD